MLKEARNFIEESKKKRPSDANAEDEDVEVMQKALCDIYNRMRATHRDVVLSQYSLRNGQCGQEFALDKKTMQVNRTGYPEKFAKLFISKLREAGKKPKLTQTTRGIRTVRRKRPMMFMNAGSVKCSMHNTVMCPTQPCPYTTLNKKVALTMKSRVKITESKLMKTLAFGKSDLQTRLKKVFMQNEELDNCRFMPMMSEKSTQIMARTNQEGEERQLTTKAEVEKYFDEKFDKNFKKSDPQIFKSGILKRAKRMFNMG